ncbi:hypothetical protein [Thiospirillum jenense]|uniref:DUF3782 domain-containing protein n=1 Tax=Thiospirillum jenense TaxID=1653858 RepID=A0A839HCR1_9GAMM|nr:hypothetical protein [Thiospirillum jenense]MBB1125930.1 hypothetical protein [Thiospirillum jenense]
MSTTYEEILNLFRETDRKFQETDRKFQELAASHKETDHTLQELAASHKETDRTLQELAASHKETDRILQELAASHKETERFLNESAQRMEKKTKALEELFVGQWGKLMESLVEGDLVALLRQRDILIADTSTRLKGRTPNGGNYEFDILAHNGDEVVVVEVKTTLRPKDVTHFIAKLDCIKEWVPRYANNRMYGAVAWLTANAGAEEMAIKRGLLSIRATGNSASIQNPIEFMPRQW